MTREDIEKFRQRILAWIPTRVGQMDPKEWDLDPSLATRQANELCDMALASLRPEEEGRVAKLEQAIKHANDWLVAGEGVDLLYYHEAYLHGEESRDIIAALIDPTFAPQQQRPEGK